MTVGKFYATFLIQDYFRRFKKRKEQMRKASVREHASALQVLRCASRCRVLVLSELIETNNCMMSVVYTELKILCDS